MQECGLTFLEAMMYVRKKRPIEFPNFGFQPQLMEFEKTLRAKNPHHFSIGGIKKPSTVTTLAQSPRFIQQSITPTPTTNLIFTPVRALITFVYPNRISISIYTIHCGYIRH